MNDIVKRLRAGFPCNRKIELATCGTLFMGEIYICADCRRRQDGADEIERLTAYAGALEADAKRWRFRQDFLANNGAFLYGAGRCMLYRDGICVGSGSSEQEAVDAALERPELNPSTKEKP